MRWSFSTQTLHLQHLFTISRGSSRTRQTVLVSVEHEGLTGWGEAAPNPRHGESIERVLETLEGFRNSSGGNDPYSFQSFMQAAEVPLRASRAARAGVEAALMDWWGKAHGFPVWRILGRSLRQMPPTSKTIAIASPAEVVERVHEAEEFHVLKIKLGCPSDREIISAVRSVTGQKIRVDANEGWESCEAALREIEWLADQNVELIEQPLPAGDHAGMRWLRSRSPLPLFADEAVSDPTDLPRVSESYHGINVKLAKSGGIFPAIRLVETARAFGLTVMVGCMVESSCGVAAAAPVALGADFADLDSHLLIDNDPFSGLEVKAGRVRLSPAPGLGVALVGEEVC